MLLRGDARALPLRDGMVQSDAHFVESLRPSVEVFHCPAKYIWPARSTHVPPTLCDTRLLAFFFDDSELKAILGLPAFDAEVWQECLERERGSFICESPIKKATSVFRVGFGCSDASSEDVREQFKGGSFDLAHVDSLAVRGSLGVAHHTHRVGVSFDADCAIGIENASQVSKLQFRHIANTTREWRCDKGGEGC